MSFETKLQEGIYYDKGIKPGNHLCMTFLSVRDQIDAPILGKYLSELWTMYDELKKGKIRDLPNHIVPSNHLTILIGFGINLFKKKLRNAKRSAPDQLEKYSTFKKPLPTGGGPILQGAGLMYDDDIKTNPATEDILIQFIADSQLAVDRCVVETWKFLNDKSFYSNEESPLVLGNSYTGFQRDDFRSWIDFHDGISNMESGTARLESMRIKETNIDQEKWTQNGTYISFMRIRTDLSIWRKLSTVEQELAVGRNKLTGCPIISITESGLPVVIDGCPVPGTSEVTETGNEHFKDISEGVIKGDKLPESHIHKANMKRSNDTFLRDSNRIFRQGYEFFEPIDISPGFRVGLNFVSFQDTPRRLNDILTSTNWLGKANFGGSIESSAEMKRFLTIRAAGYYFVPPYSKVDKFPGSSIFLE